MSNQRIHSIAGLFHTPDDIMRAARETVQAGFRKFDVNTPYPVHGMEKAMKLPRSPLGYVAFVLGIVGMLTALSMMYWTMVVNYPLQIGGKPQFPLPAFVPIMFELTVLIASVGTVAIMVIVLFKFPNNSHPIHDTNYMKACSSDKYGVMIEAVDKNFDEEKVTEFLKSIGATDIEIIYWAEEKINFKRVIWDPKFVTGLVVLAVVTSGVAYWGLNKMLFKEPFTWMQFQHRLAAQSMTTFFKDGFSMREPVEGTVARGFKPYPYPDSVQLAEKFMINPLTPTKENLEKGKKLFNTYCSPCHNYTADGHSRLNGQFPNPPSLHTDKVRNWPDGHIFHIITMGQNTMPSYASQIAPEERWEVILYVRALQRALNAKEGDLK